MGVKNVEQIKSIFLVLLVSLSLILTFSIWSYKPNYKTIEESQIEQIEIGKQKELYEVIKPIRILANGNGSLTGTVENKPISTIMKGLNVLEATDLRFIQSNLSEEDINKEIREEERMTLFFPTEVPINTFSSILKFSQNQLPDVTFSRLIIDWNNYDEHNNLRILFISDVKRIMYSTQVAIENEFFESTFMDSISKMIPYMEYERDNALSLYVPVDEVELEQYIYKIDEISPKTFKDVLFKEPNIVQEYTESATSTKYTDGMSIMTSDAGTKTINYVYPASESINDIKHSDLLQNSFDFINDHGGMTGDFRYVYSNVSKHITEYQLFLKGLPVYSSVTTNRITTTWGEKQIFRYKRPFFQLEMDFSAKSIRLPNGIEMIETLQNVQEIDDIVLGYYITQNDNNLIYTLEPSWFIIRDDSWTRLTSELIGGIEYGLE